MKTLTVLSIFFFLLTVCCQKEKNNTQFVFDQPFELKYGETKNNAESGLIITLDSVVNDSRCPGNALCIWAGNAEVRLVYLKDNHSVRFILNTLPSFKTDTIINGYNIELVNLSPYPLTDTSIKQTDYKATIKVTRE